MGLGFRSGFCTEVGPCPPALPEARWVELTGHRLCCQRKPARPATPIKTGTRPPAAANITAAHTGTPARFVGAALL
ncbi:MAG: hypothetical protein KME26_25690 [Oscillatoria princeps RMCB-10]|nr:hypothetical protein [Oscillatoria princeps RMCB-10]